MSLLQETQITHCPRCGSASIIEFHNAVACRACGYKLFINCAAATGCLAVRDGSLLMVVRKKDPGKGLLDLPGGFVDFGESLETGMRRELNEEIGLAPERLTYLTSGPNTYLYKDVLYHTVDCFFTAVMPVGIEPCAGDDAESLTWVHLDDIDEEKIAFDSVKAAIRLYKEKYR